MTQADEWKDPRLPLLRLSQFRGERFLKSKKEEKHAGETILRRGFGEAGAGAPRQGPPKMRYLVNHDRTDFVAFEAVAAIEEFKLD